MGTTWNHFLELQRINESYLPKVVRVEAPKVISKEIIFCPCGAELTLTAQATCLACHQTSYTSRELREQLKGLDAQLAMLRAKASELQMELFIRERRRTETDYKGRPADTSKQGFWKGVHGAPRAEARPQRDFHAEARALLAQVSEEV
jgi:hypothetical protein